MGISIITLVILLLDFLTVNEFYIEGSFLASVIVSIILNIIRQISIKAWWFLLLGLLSNTIIVLLCLYVFYILWITFFGYCFTGRQIETIWILAVICTCTIFILTMYDFIKLLFRKM